MKCDKYMQLLEKFEEEQISAIENEELLFHIKSCDRCRQEYILSEKFKLIGAKIRQNKPVFCDKESLIDDILNQLPDKPFVKYNNGTQKEHFLPYRIRQVITSIAASLVMFFVVQQGYDAWQIKKLENRLAYHQNSVDYSLLKAIVVIKYLNHNTDFKLKGLLAKAKKVFIDETFAKFQNKHELLTDNKTNKQSDSGLIFPLDSNYHH
jgi:hypothetical protein